MPSSFPLKNGKIKICAVMLRKMGVLLYKGPVYMESFVAYPSYPACRANFSYIFLHTWRTVYARNKKLARPAGDPPKPRFTLFQWTGPSNDWNPRFILFQGSGHPSNRAIFLHINTLVQLGQGETIRAGASAVVRSWLW